MAREPPHPMPRKKLFVVLVVAAIAPALLAYIALATVNVYLDFLFPLELYFLHIAYEVGSHRLHTGLHPHSHAPEGGVQEGK
jgi:hypothetical protein